ncbi:MAG TPA: EthD family reductase [Streptosporangiaceae bacterium]|nr:EthD family reductase [Streptosporangiaceae bacterium]
MTVKLMVLYTHPGDADAFDEHYLGTHLPLVGAIPGLERAESGRIVTALDGGEKTFYRVADLYFADQKALEAAFGTAEGRATAADYQKIAPPGSRMFVVTLAD